jgi:integrase/recombinase XerD
LSAIKPLNMLHFRQRNWPICHNIALILLPIYSAYVRQKYLAMAGKRAKSFQHPTSGTSLRLRAAPGIRCGMPSSSCSARAGLRAGEIANLTWDMVVDATGQVSSLIELRDAAAKKGSGRSIPIALDLAAALTAWRQVAPRGDHVIASERGGPMTPLSIVVWFNRAFKSIGLRGCSSHSGRRTFVTRAARVVHKAGGSLRDVQLLAGHRSIQTTQAYIDGDSDAQRKLVALIWRP